jgi:pyrroloquinoline-quinone synthase
VNTTTTERQDTPAPAAACSTPSLRTWRPEEFEARLRACEARYHSHHPFNLRLNRGELQPFQVRGWVANRFYYQLCIPQKDAAVLANCAQREERRRWLERILDHDGRGPTRSGRSATCSPACASPSTRT